MRNIIALEYAKLRKFQTLKILFAVYMLIVPSWMYFMNFFFQHEPDLKMIFTQDNPLDFPHIWSFITFSASFFNILLAVLVVIITTNDIQYKTMRQNIIEGSTKHQVILGKFVFVVFLSTIATLYTFLCGLVIGLIESSNTDIFENIHLIALYFVQTIGYFSFAFLFAILVKRPAIAIVTFILYFPVESIVGNIISKQMYTFFPLKVYADLTPIPFFKAILNSSEKGANAFILSLNEQLLLAGFYVVLCFAITYFILRRRDL
ncbi:ABC-2 family transporter protein [compost metagenome]